MYVMIFDVRGYSIDNKRRDASVFIFRYVLQELLELLFGLKTDRHKHGTSCITES